MGAKNSLPIEAVDGFSPEEVSRLEKRFRKLDSDGNNALSVAEFLQMPELRDNPIVQRVVQVFDADHNGELDFAEFVKVFDADHNGELDFAEFVKGLAMFTMKNVERERKLRFLFDIYDIDGDGLICNSELYKVLKMMVGSNLKEDQLQQIVDKTILQLDKDSDGMINYQEFCDIVGQGVGEKDEEDVTTALTIDVPKV